MSVIDSAIALRVLKMIATPFEQSAAFRSGVIDAHGKLLVHVKDQTPAQISTYGLLDRLVFNMKRLIAKMPGGLSTIAGMTAALFLIREQAESRKVLHDDELEEQFTRVVGALGAGVTPIEESLEVQQFLEDAEAPTNNTSGMADVDNPIMPIQRRKKPKEIDGESE